MALGRARADECRAYGVSAYEIAFVECTHGLMNAAPTSGSRPKVVLWREDGLANGSLRVRRRDRDVCIELGEVKALEGTCLGLSKLEVQPK
jgi:hypothetical protein